MRNLLGAAIIALSFAPAAARAQSFEGVPLRVGDTIYVTEKSGVEISGTYSGGLGPSTLTLDGYHFTPATVVKIERRGDPIWDGILKGAGIGVLLGALTPGACETHSCIPSAMIDCAIIGMIIDWRHLGRTTVYPRPERDTVITTVVSPLLGQRKLGLMISKSF